MKPIACLLLLSGWLISLAALVMLKGYAQRGVFLAAGLAVEGLGLALLTQAYSALQRRQR